MAEGALAADGPDAAMMAGPEKLAQFLETRDAALLQGVFSHGDVSILENFPPHLFRGQAGLAQWRAQMTTHVTGIQGLRHRFGAAQDFRHVREGDRETAFFTLPTDWTGVQGGRRFDEHGGWSFLLAREGGVWRIRSYGWSVVRFEQAPAS